MKKLLSLGLATTLALSMAAPAAAWGGGGSSTPTPSPSPSPSESQAPAPSESQTPAPSDSQTPAPTESQEPGKVTANLTGTTMGKDTTIDISLPSSLNGTLIINPYRLTYSDGYNTDSKSVITSGYKYIKNESKSDLKVVWEVTGTASEGVVLEKKAPSTWTATQGKAKSVFLPVMISETTGNDPATNAPTAADTKNDTNNPVYVTTETQTNASTSSSQNDLIVHRGKYLGYGIATAAVKEYGSAPKTSYWDVTAATKGAWASDGTYPKTGVTLSASTAETDFEIGKLDEPWTAEDTVDVSFVFTFEVA